MIANLVFVIVLWGLYHFWLVNFLQFPCQPLWISDATFVLGIESLLQAFGKPIRQHPESNAPEQEEKNLITIRIFGVDIPMTNKVISFLTRQWNKLYLNWPKTITIPILVIALFCIVGGLLFPTVRESSPIVFEFVPQSSGQSALPGSTITVTSSTLITAKLDGACAFPCQWHTISGKVEQREMCKAYYTPPENGAADALTVIARSPCKTTQTEASIFIRSVK